MAQQDHGLEPKRELDDDARVGDVIIPFSMDGDDDEDDENVAYMNLSAIIRREVHRALAERS
jgi:hypothetical protein